MEKGIRAALAATLGILAMAVSTGAMAHDRGKHFGHRGHGWGHYKHHGHHHYHYPRHEVVRERIFIRQPPPMVYEQHVHYGRPAIVIGVDIPPLVVRLR